MPTRMSEERVFSRTAVILSFIRPDPTQADFVANALEKNDYKANILIYQIQSAVGR
jgi:hypothetical protein